MESLVPDHHLLTVRLQHRAARKDVKEMCVDLDVDSTRRPLPEVPSACGADPRRSLVYPGVRTESCAKGDRTVSHSVFRREK